MSKQVKVGQQYGRTVEGGYQGFEVDHFRRLNGIWYAMSRRDTTIMAVDSDDPRGDGFSLPGESEWSLTRDVEA